MVIQLLVGSLISVINIMVHALLTVTAVSIARSVCYRRTSRPRVHLMGVMVATVLVLMLAHTSKPRSGPCPMRSSARRRRAAISCTSPW